MAPKATMRSVERGESPSETIVNAASEMTYVTDTKDRRIGYIKPSALHRIRLMRILGPENSKNEPLLGNCYLAYLVREVDGEKIPPCNSERQLDAIIGRLDDPGMTAVGLALAEEFGIQVDPDDNSAVETAKN